MSSIELNNIQEKLDELKLAYIKLLIQHNNNLKLLDKLQPKVGKKRKFWQIGI